MTRWGLFVYFSDNKALAKKALIAGAILIPICLGGLIYPLLHKSKPFSIDDYLKIQKENIDFKRKTFVRKISKSETYAVRSDHQSGGITAGKIDSLVQNIFKEPPSVPPPKKKRRKKT